MRLGTVGVLENGIFRGVTSLSNLDIAFKILKDPLADGSLDVTSTDGVSIELKAAGKHNSKFQSIAEAEAGALVTFSRANAVVLQLRDMTSNRIADQALLRRDLLRAIALADESKQWLREWVVITEVVEASSATILISNSGESRIELRASGTVSPTSLADASAKLQVASESKVSTKIISEHGLTPLYRGLRVRQNFWWLYDEVLPASADVPQPDAVFDDLDPNEDLADAEPA